MNQITKTIGLYEAIPDCCAKWTEALEALTPLFREGEGGFSLKDNYDNVHRVKFCPWCGTEK